jgi:hypothetical protein
LPARARREKFLRSFRANALVRREIARRRWSSRATDGAFVRALMDASGACAHACSDAIAFSHAGAATRVIACVQRIHASSLRLQPMRARDACDGFPHAWMRTPRRQPQ